MRLGKISGSHRVGVAGVAVAVCNDAERGPVHRDRIVEAPRAEARLRVTGERRGVVGVTLVAPPAEDLERALGMSGRLGPEPQVVAHERQICEGSRDI